MAATQPGQRTRVLRFDIFEVDPTGEELRRDGQVIPLQDKPFQLLLLLLEKAGEPVGREEICRRLWGADTFVEFDDNLNHAVKKLREALSDSAESPRFIKTLPRRGYCFLAPVEAEESPQKENAGVSTDSQATKALRLSGRRTRRIAILFASGSVLLISAAAFVYLYVASVKDSIATWTTVRLTSLAGYQAHASWSPDSRFMAFAGGHDIFVMPVAGGDAVQVTRGPEYDTAPRWSPDGRRLAFLSDHQETKCVYLTPPLGGARQLLADTNLPYIERFIDSWRTLGSMPWSPDGRELLFSRLGANGRIAVWKINIETQHETPVTVPPAGCDDQLASWSFDGQWIAFTRRKGGNSDLWLLPVRGGDPAPLLEDVHDSNSPAFSPNSRRVVFQSNRSGPQNLWEIDIASRRIRPITSGTGTDTGPVVSRKGGLLYSHRTYQLNFHSLDLATRRDRRLTQTVGKNYQPRISPDGNQLVYYADRRSDFDIWLLDQRSNAERSIAPHPATDIAPDWSPDSRHIVFVSNRDGAFRLWLADAEKGVAKRLLDQPVVPPAGIGTGGAQRPGARWSPDGRKIGFLAEKDGHVYLCSVNAGGGDVRWLEPDVAGFDWYRGSGRIVYSRSHQREMRIKDLEKARDELLYYGPHLDPAVSPDGSGILFTYGGRHFDQELYLLRLNVDSSGELPRPAGRPVQLTSGKGAWHVHQSDWFPDGRAVVYDRHDVESDIYLIDNYR